MVKVTSLIVKVGSGLSFGVRAWTEKEIRCVKGMYRLKLVSCENKGLSQCVYRVHLVVNTPHISGLPSSSSFFA